MCVYLFGSKDKRFGSDDKHLAPLINTLLWRKNCVYTFDKACIYRRDCDKVGAIDTVKAQRQGAVEVGIFGSKWQGISFLAHGK